MNASQIREHMEILGSDGAHVGQVDHLEGNSIKMTKNDPAAGGQHHFIPADWVDHVHDQHVHLKKSSAEVFQQWQTEPAQA